MKYKFLFCTIFFPLLFLTQSVTWTDVNDKKVNEFIKGEQKLNSIQIEPESENILPSTYAQPIIFKRKEKNIPDLLVNYKFNKNDSIIYEIEYEWDVANFEKQDNNKKSLSFQKLMIEKYLNLTKTISQDFGHSEKEGELENLKKINEEEGLTRSDTWISNRVTISASIVLSNYYKQTGFITYNPTNRIRLAVVNIEKIQQEEDETKPKLSDKVVDDYKKSFTSFIENLKGKKYQNCRDQLSEAIKKTASDDVLDKLSNELILSENLVLHTTGTQFLNDGKMYNMIQYRYENDDKSVPSKIIVVTYEDGGKILGIKPMTLTSN